MSAAGAAVTHPADRPGSSHPGSGSVSGSGDPKQKPTLDRLRARLRELSPLVVAFSGGADSAFLAWVAHDTLGAGSSHAVTAVSPSLAPEEEADCGALAREWGLHWSAVVTRELANPDYSANDGRRCYWCKTELMSVLTPIAEGSAATVVLGVNLDDLGDHRPGQEAAAEAGAAFPLVDAGFTKADVREWSQRLGLRTWDKPAAACLASRVPYGTRVSLGVLESVARAESALRALGFRQLRVRHYGDLARLEIDGPELARAFEAREDIVAAVKAAGYSYVTLDLEGFRSGNLNSVLSPRAGAQPRPPRRSGGSNPAGAVLPKEPS
ncbi:MAG TPA: ATP-dependent sacrificial sulfur transferase LarE [Acidimicrobiales bacterium]|nr:ATP-dependent sacrificial sulfur transferase LarE [Acidimicrobiales bacterium]